MKYRITHSTRYGYDEAIPLSHNVVRMKPRENETQSCLQYQLLVLPAPTGRHDGFDLLAQAVFVNVDTEARTFRHVDMAGFDAQRRRRDILGESGAGDGEAPCNLLRHRGYMYGRGRGETGLAGLAGNIDLHAKLPA